jgi:hypothetical protein
MRYSPSHLYLIQATPLASDGVTQNGPLGIVYFDMLDREVGRDTQGFDASTIRAPSSTTAMAAWRSRATINSTFTYDPNGKQTAGLGLNPTGPAPSCRAETGAAGPCGPAPRPARRSRARRPQASRWTTNSHKA